MNIRNNSYCVFPHPIGMHRSVEDAVPIQNLHPMGMHPRMQFGWNITGIGVPTKNANSINS